MIGLCVDARTGVYYMEACNCPVLRGPNVAMRQAQNE